MPVEPGSQPRDPEDEREFHLEEYRQLRAEILFRSRVHTQLEVFTVMAVALIFWFAATSEGTLRDRPEARFLIWWSPVFIIFTGFILSRSFVKTNYRIGAYLKRIEKRFAMDGQGWEHSLQPDGGWRRPSISLAKATFWLVLTVLSLVTSAVFTVPNLLARFQL